jgi:hypothetical protein
LLLTLSHSAQAEPPIVPVGLDAYRMWDRWPYQRIGARAYMRSTYDRRGGNESADASHYLYQASNTFNVPLDVQGPGILYFARYNHWHGSPWHYEVDGADHLVQESSSANPLQPVADSVFMPARLFPNPLTWTWSITKGADLMWVPIPFEKSFRMAYTRTRYGTGYYIFHQYVRGANLSQPIRSWDAQTPPGRDVLELLRRAGTDIAPRPQTLEGQALGVIEQTGALDLPANGAASVLTISKAPSMLRALEFTVPKSNAVEFSRATLRVTWDNRAAPSIDTPVGLFFGAGTFYNRDGREYLVKAFPVFVRDEHAEVHMACFFPMPFFREARIELVGNGSNLISSIQWSARFHPFTDPPNEVGYFHATYRDHPAPEPGKDLVLLDTRESEGGGDWTGSFVGTSFIFTHRNFLGTLEGDPRFFFDDSLTPQAQGTGTEEWAGGGDYWGGRNMTLPFAGHPVGARDIKEAQNAQDQIHSAYRFLLADLMPFGRNAVIRLEHGGRNESTEHYKTVTYWYGLPGASLVKTDELKIGDAASENTHGYNSPDVSAPYQITSRYEWGVDTIRRIEAGHTNDIVVYPPHTDTGRKMRTFSEFTLKLEPNNFGALLRRKLDYSFPDQRAEVFVGDPTKSELTDADWKSAGTWYLAGANTCVYSDAKGELGETQHNVQTSNRRFRDDEFLIPRDLTEGRSSIRLRVKFTPVNRPLFPGHPLAELAWSEIRYDTYCFVMPPLPK